MKNKWLSILAAAFGLAVLMTGCNKDEAVAGPDFFPAASIKFIVADSTIKLDSIRLNPLYPQPEITIKIHSTQGVNVAKVEVCKNNGTPGTNTDLTVLSTIGDQTYTLYKGEIVFTVPAGTIDVDDKTIVFQVYAEGGNGWKRTYLKPATWDHGTAPVITLNSLVLPDTYGAQPVALNGDITSFIGIKNISYYVLRGAFDNSVPANLTRTLLSTTSITQLDVFQRAIAETIPANATTANANGIAVVVTDQLNRTTENLIFVTPKAAPTFASFPTELPEGFASGTYTLAGTVNSVGGLKSVKIETLAGNYSGAGGARVITGSTLIQDNATPTNPTTYAVSVPLTAAQTLGQFGVRVTATDRFGQVSVLERFALVVAAPVVTLGQNYFQPSFQIAGGRIGATITSQVNLESVTVNILTGTLAGDTPTVTGRTQLGNVVTSFADAKNYAFDLSVPATAGAIGVEVIAVSHNGTRTTTKAIYAKPSAGVTTAYPWPTVVADQVKAQAWGYQDRAGRGALWSVSQRQGYALAANSNSVPLASATTTIGGKAYGNFLLGDFIFWAPNPAADGYEMWSPRAAREYGGITYFSDQPTWTYFNNTWFMWLGNADVLPADPDYIDWSTLDFTAMYAEFAANYATTNQAAGNRLQIAQTGDVVHGLRVGDVILVCLDPNKPMATGGGRLAAIKVNGFKMAGKTPEVYSETRLNMDLILQNE